MGKDKLDILECVLGIKDLPNRKSCLQLALESARFHLGCSLKTGKGDRVCFECRHMDRSILLSDESDMFSALFLYLNILEQIGVVFATKRKKKLRQSYISLALKKFAVDLKKEDCKYITGLRHALAHNYGLVNIDRNGKPKYKYVLLMDKPSGKVVIPPVKGKEWNGDYLDKSEDTSVKINVLALASLVENVVISVQKGTINSELSTEEIKSRFTIITE